MLHHGDMQVEHQLILKMKHVYVMDIYHNKIKEHEDVYYTYYVQYTLYGMKSETHVNVHNTSYEVLRIWG